MPGGKNELKLADGPNKIGDPKNYLPNRAQGGVPKLDLSGNRLTTEITDIFQNSVASAMTMAALRSARP